MSNKSDASSGYFAHQGQLFPEHEIPQLPYLGIDVMSEVKFQKAVRKHFGFLAANDFSGPQERVEGDACWLTYSSPWVSILLCYGPPEFQVDMSFWLKSDPGMTLGVGDLSVIGERPESWKAAPNTEGVEAQVSWLASAVRPPIGASRKPVCR
jgi:hypothetical protein